MKNHKKYYTFDDARFIVSELERGTKHSVIAKTLGRTTVAIGAFSFQWKAFKEGADSAVSPRLQEFFSRIYKEFHTNGHTETVQTAPVAVEEKPAVAATTESLIKNLEDAFESMKVAIADLVEHEVDQRTQQKVADIQQELTELRALKEQAQVSNLGGFLRKRLSRLA